MAFLFGNDTKNDWLVGQGENDLIKGYGGNDTLKGGGGADHIDGGAGRDAVMYSDSTTGVFVDLWAGYGSNGTASGDTLVNVEIVYGSSHGDYLIGNDAANDLYGLYGDDILDGGRGADLLDGGAGYDTVSYLHSSAGVIAGLTGNNHRGDAQGDVLVGIEALQGSFYNDALFGDANANTLSGDSGNDLLYAGGGADVLVGGYGDDWLKGDIGADRMTGGPNADVFYWQWMQDTGATAATSDLVTDFNPLEGDRLDLVGIDADVYAANNQEFRFIGAAAFSGTPGEINYVHHNGETIIQMQTGTSIDVDGMIRIAGIVTPDASWFVL
jgi:serralysin